ncbi:hypothetical protein UA08_00869 [Talaromyces atroroseus]|uniref:Xylanolytic transcriptional activator regulatory domain-containing protein n=1 Tax=Talaromyces atroroseus TaxID=1441469 RepID=A0A225AZR5_TALAT|nr:hypothetical protein UA08_00869 [Talaromyces atroroseus]OKL63944.1 hypothetical protein UA08_00869 [Talaromyces atroroseus]
MYQCIFRDHAIPSRHHKRRAEVALLSRLRHYENLLREHGIDPSLQLDDDGSAGTDVQRSMNNLYLGDFGKSPQSEVESVNCYGAPTLQPPSGQFLSKGGKSIYLENEVWSSLGRELKDSDFISDDSDADSSGESKHRTPSQDSLASLHPEPVHIFKLWQIFLDNVNPLTKIIHPPLLQQQILNATSDLGSIGKGLEALLFSIYCCALLSLTDEEVQREFGQDRSEMRARFRIGAQRAFANADLMNTSDVVLLQAFSLYLVSSRVLCDRRTLWCLSGMAIRIAQQIGLHRDGSRLGLSAFETEMRRRVWWHIIYMDRTIARTSGFVSAPLPSNDTSLPLNINDSDLHPTMKESPVEKNDTSTDMIFCYMRQELGKWQDIQRSFIKESIFSGNTISFSSPRRNGRVVTDSEAQQISVRLQVVDELEETFQAKVIQYCDTSIPLHLLVSLSGRSIISTLRLLAYYPSYHYGADRKLSPLSQAERDYLFATCLEVIHNNERLHTTDCLRKFLWQFDWHFPWPALLFLFSELPHRSVLSEDTQRAWHYIDTLFLPQFSRLTAEARGPLHIVCIKLAFKAWNAQVSECRRQGVSVPPCPRILNAFTTSSRSRKGTPSQVEQNSVFDSPSLFSSAQQEHSKLLLQDFSIAMNQNQKLSQPEVRLADNELGGGQNRSTDDVQLPDFLGGPQDMPLNDGLLMDLVDWNPLFQQISPPFEMSGF